MTIKRGIQAVVVAAVLAVAVLAQTGPDEAKPKEKKAPTLTGTWVSTVTPPPESGVPAFKLIFTFGEDGNLIATGTGGQLPALGNPCQGVWAKAAGGGFRVTYLCLDFDQSLQPTGMDKIRGSLVLDESRGQFSGRLDLTNYDPLGNETFSACCAAVEGRRLELERIP